MNKISRHKYGWVEGQLGWEILCTRRSRMWLWNDFGGVCLVSFNFDGGFGVKYWPGSKISCRLKEVHNLGIRILSINL